MYFEDTFGADSRGNAMAKFDGRRYTCRGLEQPGLNLACGSFCGTVGWRRHRSSHCEDHGVSGHRACGDIPAAHRSAMCIEDKVSANGILTKLEMLIKRTIHHAYTQCTSSASNVSGRTPRQSAGEPVRGPMYRGAERSGTVGAG
jgi:hypothetical protein